MAAVTADMPVTVPAMEASRSWDPTSSWIKSGMTGPVSPKVRFTARAIKESVTMVGDDSTSRKAVSAERWRAWAEFAADSSGSRTTKSTSARAMATMAVDTKNVDR